MWWWLYICCSSVSGSKSAFWRLWSQSQIWSLRVGFLITYNLTTWVKSRSRRFKSNFLLSKQNVMWDSGQICRLKLPPHPSSSVIMLHCERPVCRHFLTLAVLASDEPAVLACVSPLRLVRKPPYRWQPDRPPDRHGLRRWMGVWGWTLSEVEKNKGRWRSPSPPPRHS